MGVINWVGLRENFCLCSVSFPTWDIGAFYSILFPHTEHVYHTNKINGNHSLHGLKCLPASQMPPPPHCPSPLLPKSLLRISSGKASKFLVSLNFISLGIFFCLISPLFGIYFSFFKRTNKIMFAAWRHLFSLNDFDFHSFRAGTSQKTKERKSYLFYQILSDKAIKCLGNFEVTCILFLF